MVVIEIAPNSNCEPVDMRVFHAVETPRAVHALYVGRDGAAPEWHDVTGWTLENRPCPALARRVDDSGEGMAVLVYGGTAGLRCRPAGIPAPWRADDPRQWGLPFLLTTTLADLRYEDETNDG